MWHWAVAIIPLGLDTLAIAAALGAAGVPSGLRLRISLLFAAVEGGMPILGLLLGAPLGKAIGNASDYVAVIVLAGCGIAMLLEDDDDEREQARRLTSATGWAAVALALSIGLDELAVGVSLGLLDLPVLPVVLALTAQAFVFSQLGLSIGARLGERLREGAEKLAGAVLIGLAAWLLLAVV